MSQLAFNGTCAPIDPRIGTWQELLTDLESNRLSRNDVIASVSFDGDEVTLFRDSRALSTTISSVSEIRVEAMAKEEMLQSALREAEQYLSSLNTSTLAVAEMFRREQFDQANPALGQLLEGIKLFVGLLRGVELTLSGTSLQPESLVERTLAAMGVTLEEQIKAQTAQDWMLLADVLEYDLVPHLNGFGDTLGVFRKQLAGR